MFDKKKWEALQEAIKGNDASQVTAAAAKLTLAKEEKYYEACVTAIEYGASDALAALLEAGGGINFSKRILAGDHHATHRHRESSENYKLTCQLIEKAFASPAAEPLLSVLYQNRRNGNLTGPIPLGDFLNKDSSEALLEASLKDETASNRLNECIVNTGLFSTDKLKFILKFADAKRDAATLTGALCKVAVRGDIDKATLLLGAGANPNLNGDQAIISAAAGGQEMVDLILPRIALKYIGNDIIMLLYQRNTDLGIMACIEAAIQKATQATVTEPATTHVVTQGDRFHRLDEDTLEEVKKLSNGSTLTTLFNFSTRQQEKLTTNEAGETFHAKPVNFNELEDGVVEAMRARLDALAEPASQPSATANDRYRKFRSAI